MKFSIVVFPGSNCEHDCYHIVETPARLPGGIRLARRDGPRDTDAVILPGGFAHGDYLRSGAMARFSPVMGAVAEFADAADRSSGSAMDSRCCARRACFPESCASTRPFVICAATSICGATTTTIPGRSSTERETSSACRSATAMATTRRLPRICTGSRTGEPRRLSVTASRDGSLSDDSNPNGSDASIAGICNEARNVVGLMPHPDRCSEKIVDERRGNEAFPVVRRSHRGGRPAHRRGALKFSGGPPAASVRRLG